MSAVRLINKKFQERLEVFVGDNEKEKQRILSRLQNNGWQIIQRLDRPCPKCGAMKFDDIGMYRAYGGVFEFFRCDACRHVEHKCVLGLEDKMPKGELK